MNSVERVKSICKIKKIPISRLEKDLGYSNGYIGQLRKGTFPNDRIVEIAEYLKVSVDYLMTGKDEKRKERDVDDIAKDISKMLDRLADDKNAPALYNGNPLSDESVGILKDELEIILRRMELINKEKHNPNKDSK